VKAHAKRRLMEDTTRNGSAATGALPDFTRWGEVDRRPMRAVRRKTAEHLGAAWATIPHVTQHDVADITALEELRRRYAKQAEGLGGKLTITAIALKVVAAALKVFPQFNVSLDLAAGEVIYKKYFHIGVAVDTDGGLFVPIIRDVDTKNIIQLSVELVQVADKARNRKLSLEEMQGGCFTVTNLGQIGGTSFTPIVNAPEVAILGISRARMEPVYADNQLVPRLMLPLSLSYDHRAVDGADGVRFVRWIAEALEQPLLLALQG
jgi:pyruvate dehydrogenase E2 component (dihydrolipoamide acetyltransferase)